MIQYTVDIRYIGRKGTMAIATLLTGIFLFLFTISTNSNFQLTFSCLTAFVQNVTYGVLYAYTPEVFPAPNRGTGTGIASFLNRIAGLTAPIIGANVPASNPSIPIYVSGALYLAAFIAMYVSVLSLLIQADMMMIPGSFYPLRHVDDNRCSVMAVHPRRWHYLPAPDATSQSVSISFSLSILSSCNVPRDIPVCMLLPLPSFPIT